MISYKTVIFDLGGVVFSSPIGRLAELETKYHMKTKTLNRHIMHCKAWKRMETGVTNPNQFVQEYDLEIQTGIKNKSIHPILQKVSGQLVMDTISNGTGIPRKQYIETINSLKSLNITTVALTNNFKTKEKNAAKGMFSQADVMKDMFDIMIESYVVGLRKPDPKIYELVCQKANVLPSQCIFLDDIGANLKPAKAMGIKTIRVMVDDVNGMQALHELETILGGKTLFTTGRQQQQQQQRFNNTFTTKSTTKSISISKSKSISPSITSITAPSSTTRRLQTISRHLTTASNHKYHYLLSKIKSIKQTHPNNRAMKYFNEQYFATLDSSAQDIFIQIIKTGIDNPDSGLGCYAMTPSDYDTFSPFFDRVIRDYHNATASSVHVTDWNASDVGDNGVLDVTKLGLKELSMRVRVGRNLIGFNLPGSMNQKERIRFEISMLKAFDSLIADPNYGGHVYSLSPDHGPGITNPNLISNKKYNQLVQKHVMFKDMDADPYLKSAGIASDWPYGRGCWQSDDQECIIWFGEEDQLRIMCMKTGTRLDEVFNRLKKMLDTVESIEGIEFARSNQYGYITSCPSNLGTGMRASVHIKVPKLTSDGQTDPHGNSPTCKAICKPLGLSVRGTGGEHTPIGKDGTIDLSPSSRLFIKEKEIISSLYRGIEGLMKEENKQ